MNQKLRLAILLFFLIGLAGSFSQEAVGTNQLKIVWAVPTNHVPPSIWMYKIVPQTFSPEVVSNLMALGSFTSDDEKHINGQPPGSRYFDSKDGARKLGIVPACGFIFYYDSAAESKGHTNAVGVPSEDEVARIGADYLQKFGIDKTEIVTVADSTNSRLVRNLGSRSWFDKTLGTNVETIYMRGAFFVRRLDGVPFDGIMNGGMHIEFGNHANISRLEILWQGLEKAEVYSTLTSAQMIEEIRSGKGKWQPVVPGNRVKGVSILDSQALYRGFPVEEVEGGGHKFCEPFVRLKTCLDLGRTNIMAVFDCPVYN